MEDILAERLNEAEVFLELCPVVGRRNVVDYGRGYDERTCLSVVAIKGYGISILVVVEI